MRPVSSRIASLVATGLVVLVLAACSGAASAPSPTAGPSAAPSEVPSPVPSGAPVSPKVSVDVVDRSGTLLKAVSGQPAEGASVDTNTIKIENIDPRTLRLTWTDFPIDNRLALYIDPQGVGFRFLLIQPEPTGPTDSIGVDRILELTFDHEISSAKVESTVQAGLDTSY